MSPRIPSTSYTVPGGPQPHADIDMHEASTKVLEEYLPLAYRWDNELQSCLIHVQQAVIEHPEIRLVACRARLDRAEEIRYNLAVIERKVRTIQRQVELWQRHVLGAEVESGASSLVTRGYASEERMATYSLRAKGTFRHVTEVLAACEEIISIAVYASNVIKAIDSHRMESITMMRASLRINAEEYSTHRG